MAHFIFLMWIPYLLITKFSLKRIWTIFLPKLLPPQKKVCWNEGIINCRRNCFLDILRRIICLNHFTFGSINFHTQRKEPAKYENLGDDALKPLSHGKAFCRQRIPQSSCARKETADIAILITSRNDDRNTTQPIRIVSGSSNQVRK